MLKLDNISKSFYQKIALDDVSFQLNEGEITGLLGPNGAGKTTLIRIINGIFEADKGSIRFNKELMAERHLANIGYLPEERGLYKNMTVYDHAILLGQLRGLTKNEVKIRLNTWLEKFEIGNWRSKRIEELSKGMAQKVQFICTVLHEPSLLILDEPFSGFDPINVELIQQELIRMKKDGKTILLSSHNMKSVEEICDSAILIHQAKKILDGRVSTIRDERKDGRYAVKFRGNMLAFVNSLWTGFEFLEKEELANDRFIAYVSMRGDSNFDDLLKTLMGNVQLEAAWEVLPSMQEIFIKEINQQHEQ